ncbi:MAG: DUF2155 domain-containing protein [Rickettsia endosymbiont of Argas persicus]
MKHLKIILAFIICINSSFIFAKELDLDLVVTTDEIEGDIFNVVNNEPPVLNSNQNVQDTSEFKNCDNAKIIALNKITAKSEELAFKIGEEKYFGNIKIKIHKCVKNFDPYNEDNYILMTVTEYKIDEDPKLLFQGWMISSSISLSTFEHPIYEIFAKECF